MENKTKKHHDNRGINWYISLFEHEAEAAESRRALTGLTKAEYGRQALMTANIISKINSEDRKMLSDLSQMRVEICRLVMISEQNGRTDILYRIIDIEDKLSEMYNYLISKNK